MNAEPRRRRSAERAHKNAHRGAAPIPQLAPRRVVNPYPPMQLLSADQVEAIHDASMHILENFGIEVMSPRALSLFEKAGAIVDHGTQNVRIGRELVAEALKTTRPLYTLTPRNRERRVILGGNNINFTLVAGPPNVHDMERGRRAGNLRDYHDLVRLAQHFNCITMIGNQVCAPIELSANSRHLDTYLANLTLTDKSFHCTAIGRGRALDGIEMMAISRGLTLEELADDPGVTTIISVNSPRRFDDQMAEGLMIMAEYGQSACVTPFTLMGAMSPVTLAGALAQQNAEALFGVVLTQLVRPGAPVMYGAFTSNVDMKSGAPAFGTPENTKANVASG
ncbi:MAG: trimethylamine methyltransferase family protein, partial [Hyphomicrobiales bacterium]|nr:trimethylamine methyltransferase family protein [Hyphomicrobiales bacterium]